MLNYAICEINGKQYKIEPNKSTLVDFLGDVKEVEAKVLALSEDKKVSLGDPYLKDSLKLKVLDTKKKDKVRVAIYHAKANYRRVTGMRPKASEVILESVKK